MVPLFVNSALILKMVPLIFVNGASVFVNDASSLVHVASAFVYGDSIFVNCASVFVYGGCTFVYGASIFVNGALWEQLSVELTKEDWEPLSTSKMAKSARRRPLERELRNINRPLRKSTKLLLLLISWIMFGCSKVP